MSMLDLSKEFAGKRALVTGGSRGIGGATAQRLIDGGAKVVVSARSRHAETPKEATFVEGDMRTKEGAEAVGKAALNNYTEGLAKEMAPLGVRVNIVTPGTITTPGGDDVRKTITSAMGIIDEQFFSTVPLKGRAGPAEDFAEVIVFLASPRASYVTSHNTFVSGGWGELAL